MDLAVLVLQNAANPASKQTTHSLRVNISYGAEPAKVIIIQ